MKIILSLKILNCFSIAMFMMNAVHASTSSFKNEITCGVALGYPPYQYANSKNEPVGIDIEISKIIFANAGLKVKFLQKDWKEIYGKGLHNDGVDALCGVEISPERVPYFNFSTPFNFRKIVLFTLKENKIKKVSDLFGKVITGDKHSTFEKYLGSDRDHIRVMETVSKEDSFLKLKNNSVTGVIAPLEVGYFMASKLGLKVSVYDEKTPGSPVTIAFTKNRSDYIPLINKSIEQLYKNGKIKTILARYNSSNR